MTRLAKVEDLLCRSLEWLCDDLEQNVECASSLVQSATGELLPVPGTCDDGAAAYCAELMSLITEIEDTIGRPYDHANPQWLDDLLDGEWSLTPEQCSGHVASATSPNICGRCGIHIDELRPSECEHEGRTL